MNFIIIIYKKYIMILKFILNFMRIYLIKKYMNFWKIIYNLILNFIFKIYCCYLLLLLLFCGIFLIILENIFGKPFWNINLKNYNFGA